MFLLHSPNTDSFTDQHKHWEWPIRWANKLQKFKTSPLPVFFLVLSLKAKSLKQKGQDFTIAPGALRFIYGAWRKFGVFSGGTKTQSHLAGDGGGERKLDRGSWGAIMCNGPWAELVRGQNLWSKILSCCGSIERGAPWPPLRPALIPLRGNFQCPQCFQASAAGQGMEVKGRARVCLARDRQDQLGFRPLLLSLA